MIGKIKQQSIKQGFIFKFIRSLQTDLKMNP
jgi:hypothetical protein